VPEYIANGIAKSIYVQTRDAACVRSTLGAKLVRDFNDADGGSGLPAVIVNRRFAEEHWPGQDPVGQHLRLYNRSVEQGKVPERWFTVVGMASNISPRCPPATV
jgi:hypothetical protein